MQIEEKQKPYLLQPELHNRIYQDIQKQLFSGLEPAAPNEKQAIYLAAQPGSGKTALRNYLIDNLKLGGNAIVLNSDELRDYHPAYHSLQSDPATNTIAPYLVNPDATQWYTQLQNDAAIKGFNLIYDTTLGGNVNDYAKYINERISQGYKPSLHVLAIHSDLSKLGIYLRYESQLLNKGTGRFVSMKAHDINYQNLVPNIAALSERISWAKVEIFTRHIDIKEGQIINNAVKPIYSAQHQNIDKDEIIRLINDERNRSFSPLEKQYLHYRFDQVENLIKGRKADLSQFHKDMYSLINTFSIDKRNDKSLSL